MKLHGKNGQIWINGSQWLTGASYQIELGRDFANVSVLGDAAQVWAGGLRGVTGSFEGLWDTGGNLPSTAAFLDVVAVAIYAAAGNPVASGDAWITVKVSGAVTDAVRCGGSIKGTGAWTIP